MYKLFVICIQRFQNNGCMIRKINNFADENFYLQKKCHRAAT